MGVTLEKWLARHPFLEPIARLEATVRDCVQTLPGPEPVPTDFEQFRADFDEGIPLLHSPVVGRKLVLEAADDFEALSLALAEADVPESLAVQVRELCDHFNKAGTPYDQALLAIATDAESTALLPHPGMARYVAWHALTHALSPTLADFSGWREGRYWPFGYCPSCGARPLLSYFTPLGDGRQRTLVCGLCSTHWKARRLGCPHCGTEDENQLAILEFESESRLRLEVCDDCKGYLKTWAGLEAESSFFFDWTTLHMDAIAADRGYLRLGASLYEI